MNVKGIYTVSCRDGYVSCVPGDSSSLSLRFTVMSCLLTLSPLVMIHLVSKFKAVIVLKTIMTSLHRSTEPCDLGKYPFSSVFIEHKMEVVLRTKILLCSIWKS